MLSLSSVSAWIEVDGKELEQYGVEEDLDRNQVTCWIATQADKAFSVVFRDNAPYREHSLTSLIQLDGSSIAGKLCRPPSSIGVSQNDRTVVQNSQISSATSSRPFIFSRLELTDEDEYLSQSSTHLGEIWISIYRVQPLETRLFQPSSSVSGHGKVHERAKKAVTHCVSYGQEVKTGPQYSCRVRYLDGNLPLATFIFKYRDFGLLQANGIIPKLSPAKKEAAVEDVLDLTTENDTDVKRESIDEEIEIVDSTTETLGASLSLKRSNPSRERGGQPAKKIKREKKYVPTGEIIDLT